MSLEWSQFFLVLTAVVAGWALGRYGSSRKAPEEKGKTEDPYYRGLNYLINNEPDATIDAFVDSLAVTPETLETHLSVGALLRKRGEVERAIKVHQNLLAKPDLPNAQKKQVHLELARNYISAGLFDRAERMLQDLRSESGELQQTALAHLREIYEHEREWEQAIAIAREQQPRKSLFRSTPVDNEQLNRAVSHYYCEIAELALARRDFHSGRNALKNAIAEDRDCVRASVILGRLELEAGHLKESINAFIRVSQQNPKFYPEVLEGLSEAFQRDGSKDELLAFLVSSYAQYPGSTLLLAVVKTMLDVQGPDATLDWLKRELRKRPTLRGLRGLISLQIDRTTEDASQDLQILADLVNRVLADKPNYLCQQCGFAGQHLHWRCPSCNHWGTVSPIRGVEGD